jgi:excinuclease ABC subunit C
MNADLPPSAGTPAASDEKPGAASIAAPAAPAFDAKSFVEALPNRPGVYRMLDAQGTILYVGKARKLKSRVGSYFQPSNVQPKVQALVAKTANMEVTITNSDTEALLLEFNLIKKHRPRFNVVLRDDKSFPYLHFETAHDFPRLSFYRGSRKEAGRFFGPYPSAGAVRETCSSCKNCFALRNCEDHVFRESLAALPAVSDPALHGAVRRTHHQGEYARDVGAAIKVLEGRNDEVQLELGRRMEGPPSG